MEDKGSKNVIDLYFKANNNKYDIALWNENGRDYSKAEMTVLACLAIVGREAEMCKLPFLPREADYNKLIKTIILYSLDGMTDGLRKKEEYDKLINKYKRIDPEVYGATVVYKSMLDNFARFLKPYNPEEKFVCDNVFLHNLIREGHIKWGANGERLESVLEHIYGCLVLAVGIESEYDYDIDFTKLYKMLLIHEEGEISSKGDMTEWDASREERLDIERKAAKRVFYQLSGGQKLYDLWEEFNGHNSLVSEYAYLIDKLEYDLQVKAYDDNNYYDFDNYPRNVVTESESVQNIINSGAKSVFDVHYEYDKKKFNRLPCTRRMLEDAKDYHFEMKEIEKKSRFMVPRLRKNYNIN
ncbi:MAG: HD domain-containing protein [Bacilli bacterium]|nr:HD domain-containing protein [Bacilli bacterium]